MARNSEKAQSMLFRFRAQQAAQLGIIDAGRTRRPKMITEVSQIPACEKWRGQVLKEISRKVTKIQDQSLSDFQIRDVNDEINKLMREKHMWEEGKEIPGGGKGYRYFGRARELPGVKEMFEAAKPKAPDKALESRADLRKNVDASYYGYNLDEEDGTLLAYEAEKEREAFENLKAQGQKGEDGWESLPGDSGDGVAWTLPTLDEVQEELVDRRRRTLLDKLG
ncbi:NineTeen Complex (NTC) component [Bacidia gigantensis]|uniref:NineTeen Complex (NTC) component n=1 Tax=Bacidia gigantensis TaxID=2732470 RepID=UPI001D0376A4|nr:NineTeen Complex (NTC) component [Bacidia gigantensis]KAG8525790.1 NineTeen Complex (NTC) component [Bacidia gigantensis]